MKWKRQQKLHQPTEYPIETSTHSTQIRIDEQYYIKRTDKWNEYICMHMHWQWADHDYDCCLWWLCTRFGNTYNKCEYAEQCCPFFRSKWNSIVVYTQTLDTWCHSYCLTLGLFLLPFGYGLYWNVSPKNNDFFSESVFCGASYEITWTEYWSRFCSPFNEWMMAFMETLQEIFFRRKKSWIQKSLMSSFNQRMIWISL